MSTSPQVTTLYVDTPQPRLDQFLASQIPYLSRSQIKKLIQQDDVLVAGQTVKPGAGLSPGDVITVRLPETSSPRLVPEEMPLNIVYADEAIIVVNKPASLVVHPALGHDGGTLVNGLLARFPDLASMTTADADASLRPGIVHRLDQDTSGLMVVARTPAALKSLRRQFKGRSVAKTYLALVYGYPEAPEGIIDVPLARDPRNRQKFAAHPEGKPARTTYRVKTAYHGYSLLEVGLETGRTHQIRVHLAWLKCPVVGDTVYGRKKNPLGLARQFLHAWRLAFEHPASGQPVQFEAPLDADLQAVLNTLP